MPSLATRPTRSMDDFVLTQVHDSETKAFTRSKNADSWKSQLSVEEYVMREHVLGLSKMASLGGHELMVFIMTKKDEPDVPLCSCELLVRKAYRYTKTDTGVERRDVMSGCIGAVFTYKEHRAKGYASVMIDHLVKTAKSPLVLGEDGFIFLYSEVGEYYTRNGFKSFHVPLAKFAIQQIDRFELPPNVELIKFHEFERDFKEYSKDLDAKIRQSVSEDGIERITTASNEHYVDWFHLRVKYIAHKLFDKNKSDWDFSSETIESLATKFKDTKPEYFGLRLFCPNSGTYKGFIVWTYDYEFNEEENKFHNYVTVIKKFVAPEYNEDETTLELFLLMTKFLGSKHEGHQMSNMEQVKLWESEVSPSVMDSIKQMYGAKGGLENGSRSAILINRKEDDIKMREGKIVWEDNTKLLWF